MSSKLLNDFLEEKVEVKEEVISKEKSRRIVSIDIGIKNLAYCVMSTNPNYESGFEIHDWRVLNLLEEEYGGCEGIIKSGKNKGNMCNKQSKIKVENEDGDVNFYCSVHNPDKTKYKPRVAKTISKYIDMQRMCIKVHETLISNSKLFENVDEVVIEKQLSKSPKNIQMAHLVFSFFILNGVVNKDSSIKKVKFIHASNKLKVYQGPPIYCHLKDAKSRRKWLAIRHCEYILKDKKWKEYMDSLPRKKDDLSDSFLQGAWHLKYGSGSENAASNKFINKRGRKQGFIQKPRKKKKIVKC